MFAQGAHRRRRRTHAGQHEVAAAAMRAGSEAHLGLDGPQSLKCA
jgi:hypothetical protein